MSPATVIGTVGSTLDVLVDARGAVAVDGQGWSLEWAIGAADRWHHPDEEPVTAVNQHRIDGTPVLATSVRVPRGQVVHRAWCVAGRGGDVAVVELENRSQEPVAAALLVRVAGRAHFDGDRSLRVDGRPMLVLGRRPARTAAGATAEVRRTLSAGEGRAPGAFDVRRSTVAFVFPLAHTASLRVALAVDAEPPTDVDALPAHDAVARGWRGHLDAGARVGLPDDALSLDLIAARAALLVRSDRSRPREEAAVATAALDAWGHHDAAAIAAADLLGAGRIDRRGDTGATAAVLAAVAGHARATGDAAWAEPIVGAVAKAAHRLSKAAAGAPSAVTAQADAADLLDVAGQPEAAALCRDRIASVACPPSTVDPVSLPELRELGSAVTGLDDAATARFLLRVRDLLVDDTSVGALAMLPDFPDEWLGQEIEAHRLPTRAGLLSFAVRWHGPRPALLWERHGDRPALLRCPGLDPQWASDEPVGEALLGLVEPAGGLPKVVAPLGAGTAVDDAPADGASFR